MSKALFRQHITQRASTVDFAAASRGGKEFAKIGAVVTEMERNGVKKLAGSGVFHGGAGNKALAAEAAMTLLRQIRKTAVAIADAEEMPEFDDKFVVPRSNAFEGVLASVRTFLAEATPHSALFIDFKLPADFLTKLQQLVVRMEKGGAPDSCQIFQDARFRIHLGISGITPVRHTLPSRAGGIVPRTRSRRPLPANPPWPGG